MGIVVCLSIDQGELLKEHRGVEVGGRKERGSDDEFRGAQLPKSQVSIRIEMDSKECHGVIEANLSITKKGTVVASARRCLPHLPQPPISYFTSPPPSTNRKEASSPINRCNPRPLPQPHSKPLAVQLYLLTSAIAVPLPTAASLLLPTVVAHPDQAMSLRHLLASNRSNALCNSGCTTRLSFGGSAAPFSTFPVNTLLCFHQSPVAISRRSTMINNDLSLHNVVACSNLSPAAHRYHCSPIFHDNLPATTFSPPSPSFPIAQPHRRCSYQPPEALCLPCHLVVVARSP
ncbi:hypothetical protein B296_00055031 [Ensete ventricosum]|uniref:Uncharacterized protein n=1 Tax=Ensete ventricosum TaxID=4639 RepID=A0A426WY22_ENSVE|nr:hypothetical protein B296_00055031 [Ensete ventricosum]